MRRLAILLLALVLLPLAHAEPLEATLLFKDANTNKPVANVPLVLTATNAQTGEILRFARFIDDRGFAKIDLGAGSWNIDAKVDLPNTPGYDYFGEQTISMDKPKTETIFLVPGGTLRGTVVDKLGNVVGFAELKFDCPSATTSFPSTTDKFGIFAVEWIALGTCVISGKYGNAVGSQTLTITQGEVANIEIKLDKLVVTKTNTATWIIPIIVGIIVIIIVIIIIIILIKRLKPKKISAKKSIKQKPAKETKKEPEINKRSHDIIKTLNHREKQVVEFLLQNPDTSQAKIYNNTGIAKTSLARILQSLTHKNITTMEKIGKLKKVKLTAWFMGKE